MKKRKLDTFLSSATSKSINPSVAEHKDPFAQFNLAVRYENGMGVIKDLKEAAKYYQLAAQQGHADAQNNLGLCYNHGKGVKKNAKKALKWFQLAAQQGHPKAQNNLGLCHEHGKGVEKNAKEALKWFQLAAQQGHADSQNNLGICYEHGIGVIKDLKEAAKYYQLAAQQRHAYAQNNLGFCYQHGKGVIKDLKEAAKYYQLAAQQGHAHAQNNLGLCYEHGIGIIKDLKEAAKYYQLAAQQGHAHAQNNLGLCYEFGKGVEKNAKETLRWLQFSAQQGHADAQNNLGFCYEHGKGVKKDCKKAENWYQSAAKQGHISAQENLTLLIQRKTGNLSHQNIDNEKLALIAYGITGLTQLNLSHNTFDDKGLQKLPLSLSDFPHLHTLNISYNPHLSSEGIALLIKKLPDYPSLKILDNRGNSFSGQAVTALAETLPFLALRELNLDDCKLVSEDGWDLVGKQLSSHSQLTSLGSQFLELQAPGFQSTQQMFNKIQLLHGLLMPLLPLPLILCQLIYDYMMENESLQTMALKYILENITHRLWEISPQKDHFYTRFLSEPSSISDALKFAPEISLVSATRVDMGVSFYRKQLFFDGSGAPYIGRFFKEPTEMLKKSTGFQWESSNQKNRYLTKIKSHELENLQTGLTNFAGDFTSDGSCVNFDLKMNPEVDICMPLSSIPVQFLRENLPNMLPDLKIKKTCEQFNARELKFAPNTNITAEDIISEAKSLKEQRSRATIQLSHIYIKGFRKCNYNKQILSKCFASMSHFYSFDETEAEFSLMIPFFPALKYLKLMRKLSAPVMKKLISILPDCLFLGTLDFTHNVFSEENAHLLAKVLPYIFVKELLLVNDAIPPQCLSHFFQALNQNERITNIGGMYSGFKGSLDNDFICKRLSQNVTGDMWSYSTAVIHSKYRYAEYLANSLLFLPIVLVAIITDYFVKESEQDKGLYFSLTAQALETITGGGCTWDLGSSSNHYQTVLDSETNPEIFIKALKEKLPTVSTKGALLNHTIQPQFRFTLGELTEENYHPFIDAFKNNFKNEDEGLGISHNNLPSVLKRLIGYSWASYRRGFYYCNISKDSCADILEYILSRCQLMFEFLVKYPKFNLRFAVEDCQRVEINITPEQVQKLLSLVDKDKVNNYVSRFNYSRHIRETSSASEADSQEIFSPLVEVTEENVSNRPTSW